MVLLRVLGEPAAVPAPVAATKFGALEEVRAEEWVDNLEDVLFAHGA